MATLGWWKKKNIAETMNVTQGSVQIGDEKVNVTHSANGDWFKVTWTSGVTSKFTLNSKNTLTEVGEDYDATYLWEKMVKA